MSYEDTDDAAGVDEFIFCEGCGARLYATDRTCPKCGRPAPGILSTSSASADLAAGRTSSFPRLSSEGADFSKKAGSAPQIITSSFDPSETHVLSLDELEAASGADSAKKARKRKKKEKKRRAGKDEPRELTEDDFKRPHRWRWVVVLVVIALLVGLAWFVVEDPLGVMPGLYDEFAQAASEAFPSRYDDETVAEIEEASEEDSTGEEAEEVEEEIVEETLSDAEVFTTISAIYTQIVDFQDELDEVVDDYNGWYIANDYSKREEASESAYTMREHVQTVLDELEGLAIADDSVYTEDVEHLTQLATWMYNRVNVLCESWDISLALGEDAIPSDYRSEIVEPLTEALDADGVNQDVVQYETYLYEWAPEEKTS